MTSKHTIPIRSSLVWLVTACLVPAVVLVAALLYSQYQRESANLVRESGIAARALMQTVDAEFEDVESSLRALSTSPALRLHDMAAFHQQASDLVQGHFINNIVVVDASGQQVMNTARSFGEPLSNAGNPGQFRRVLASGQPDISNLFMGTAVKRPLISVGVPVRQGNRVTHSLAGAILATHFQKLLLEQRPSNYQIAVITDASATIVARTHEIDRYIGQSVVPSLVQAIREREEGSLETVSLEGIPILLSFVRSPVSRWSVIVATPINILTAELRRSLWLLSGFAVLLLAFTLGLAWVLGGRITRSIHALGGPALALGHGQALVVPRLPVREADEVGQAITKASAMLVDAGAALTASEERMRGIVESAMDAIITVDADQRIVLYNHSAERIFGWSKQDVLGKQLEMLMPKRFRTSHAEHVGRFSATGTTSRSMGGGALIYGQRASGEEFPLEAAISQLETTRGKMFSAILRDVTSRMRNQAALERSNLDLQQFAFVASHDLKTPLRSIGGFMQLLEKNYADKLDDKAKMLIRRTTDATQRLEQLTEDLLSYARVNSETRAFEAVNCNEVADNVIDLLDAAVRGSDAVVTVGELPAVMGDRIQLVQLFLNLIGNAIKYCAGRSPEVHVSAMHNGSAWVFSVRDNGIGIDSKHHERIFEIFKRLHTQKEYVGTGIGLAICRRIVEHHGGEIWVNSESGRGSTFCFTIADISAESSLS